jgi:hypothetical protein
VSSSERRYRLLRKAGDSGNETKLGSFCFHFARDLNITLFAAFFAALFTAFFTAFFEPFFAGFFSYNLAVFVIIPFSD